MLINLFCIIQGIKFVLQYRLGKLFFARSVFGDLGRKYWKWLSPAPGFYPKMLWWIASWWASGADCFHLSPKNVCILSVKLSPYLLPKTSSKNFMNLWLVSWGYVINCYLHISPFMCHFIHRLKSWKITSSIPCLSLGLDFRRLLSEMDWWNCRSGQSFWDRYKRVGHQSLGVKTMMGK